MPSNKTQIEKRNKIIKGNNIEFINLEAVDLFKSLNALAEDNEFFVLG
ncbi:MAG: hypothetical protein K8H86_10990 [Ignavibacteriaceae bacterium]|nr:hypothetical protein [Ignavibacteriaceae bacterium]